MTKHTKKPPTIADPAHVEAMCVANDTRYDDSLPDTNPSFFLGAGPERLKMIDILAQVGDDSGDEFEGVGSEGVSLKQLLMKEDLERQISNIAWAKQGIGTLLKELKTYLYYCIEHGEVKLAKEMFEVCGQETRRLFGSINIRDHELAYRIIDEIKTDALDIYRNLWAREGNPTNKHRYEFMSEPRGMELIDEAINNGFREIETDSKSPNKGNILLELGSGAGFGAKNIIEKFGKRLNIKGYQAVEGSPHAVTVTRNRIIPLLNPGLVDVQAGDFNKKIHEIEASIDEEIKNNPTVVSPRIIFSFSTLHYMSPVQLESFLSVVHRIVNKTRGLFLLMIKSTDNSAINEVVLRETNGSGIRIAADVETGIVRYHYNGKAINNLFRSAFRSASGPDAEFLYKTIIDVSDYDKPGLSSFNALLVESEENPFTD